MRPLPCLLIPLLAVSRLLGAEPAAATCSPDEAVVLALVNAYRADPVVWDDQVTSALREGAMGTMPAGPWSTYMARIARQRKAVQPVVWDAKLTKAARSALGRFPRSAEGSPNEAAPDLTAGGVAGSPLTALLLAEGQTDLRFLVQASVLQCIKEEMHGTTTVRTFAREQLLDPGATACGVAVSRSGSGWRLAVVIGDQVKGRAAGGVAFRDANRNGRLDPGEAPIAVEVALPATAAGTPFASGVWTLPVADAAVGEGRAAIAGIATTFPIPAKPATSWTLIPAPEKPDVDEAKKLLAAAAKAKPDPDAPDKAVFDLALRRVQLALDAATAAQVEQAASPATQQIDRARREFLDGIGEDKAVVAKQLADIQRRWKGRGAEWITFAKSYHQLHQQFGAWGRSEKEERVKGARELVKAIDQLAPKNVDPVLWGQVTNWRVDLDICVYAADRSAATAAEKKDDRKKKK